LLIDPALGTTRKSTGKSRFNCWLKRISLKILLMRLRSTAPPHFFPTITPARPKEKLFFLKIRSKCSFFTLFPLVNNPWISVLFLIFLFFIKPLTFFFLYLFFF
jgi:hypothetical protein